MPAALAFPPMRPSATAAAFLPSSVVMSSISPVAILATMMALPITSAGRFSPLGPRGIGGHLHERSDQAQQCLLFWPISAAQELAQFDVGKPTTRRSVGLVNDEGMTVLRLAAEGPRIPIWATIDLPPI